MDSPQSMAICLAASLAETPSSLGTLAADLILNLSITDQCHAMQKLSRYYGNAIAEAKGELSNHEGDEHAQCIYYSTIFICTGVLIVVLRSTSIMNRERRRYLNTTACNQGRFSQYLQYRFGHWYTWTPGSSSIVLLDLSVYLLIIGGLLLRVCLPHLPLSDCFWTSWIWVAAPDGGSSAETPVGRALGVLMSVAGMLVFGFLISVISSGFEEGLQGMREGRHPVVEGDHIVILGFLDPLLLLLATEICIAQESDGGTLIAIMTPSPKIEVENFLIENNILEWKRNSTIVVRSGDMHKSEDLRSVAVGAAKRVIVLSNLGNHREEADTLTLNTIVTLAYHNWPANGAVLVQCQFMRNRRLFERLLNPCSSVLNTFDFAAVLMAQCSRQLGLANVIRSIFGFGGSEFYISKVGGIAGRTFCEVLFALPGAITVGIRTSDGDLELLPGMSRKFVGDEWLVVLAEDDSTVPKEAVSTKFEQCRSTTYLKVREAFEEIVDDRKVETIVIIGYNESIGNVLKEIDAEVGPNSKVIIHSPVDINVREAFIEMGQVRSGQRYTQITIKHTHGRLAARFLLEQLPLETASRILVLADIMKPDAEADHHTLGALVQLQDILDARCGNESRRPLLTSQLLDVACEEAVERTGVKNYVMTNRLVARIVATVSEVPEVAEIINCIVLDRSCGFCIRQLSDYHGISDLVLNDGISFDEVAAVAALANEVVLGWTLPSRTGEMGRWEMNPHSRNCMRAWNACDRLVVLKREQKVVKDESTMIKRQREIIDESQDKHSAGRNVSEAKRLRQDTEITSHCVQ